ncbi:MAG: hypothetical protein ACK5NN_10550 [Sphingomonadaceae bacterium]
MIPASRLFRSLGKGLAVLAMACAVQASAQSGIVSNTATARWDAGGSAAQISSNTVEFSVVNPQSTLTTYVPLPGAGQQFNLSNNYCASGGSGGGSGGSGGGFGAQTPVTPSSTIHPGQLLIMQVNSPLANIDPTGIDQIDLEIRSDAGDVEQIRAFETAENSGSFVGAIETTLAGPGMVENNCILSIRENDHIRIVAATGNQQSLLTGEVDARADPYGIVFDSRDGSAVNGARVTIIDNATGQPARVFAFDGVTPYPSTVISGSSASDSAGNVFPVGDGEYRFPLMALGSYRIVVEPPAPYEAPSDATPAALAMLTHPGGGAFEITDASYGRVFELVSLDPLRIDIPVDAPGGMVSVDKMASLETATPGEPVVYTVIVRNRDAHFPTTPITVTDAASSWLRLEPDSVRVNGAEPENPATPNPGGHGFSLTLDSLAPGASYKVTYAMTVRSDAPPGQAENRFTATTFDGAPVQDNAVLRITRDQLTGRMTIIGRIVAGGCTNRADAPGIAGVRVMMEDGSFAITDENGRYHFDGVIPGTHVVRAIESTLPEGSSLTDCERSTRTGGSASSRFVRGQGGSLARADFTANVPQHVYAGLQELQLAIRNKEAAPATADQPVDQMEDATGMSGPGSASEVGKPARSEAASSQEAAGANTDWLALGDGPNSFLFPDLGHNPRSSLVRVVIRHRPDQSVVLKADGKDVNPLAFDVRKVSKDKTYAVSIWRGIPLGGTITRLSASIRTADGQEVETLTREVHKSGSAMYAQILPARSNLIADGSSNPVLAVRLTDRHGEPVQSGMSGQVQLDSPYILAAENAARRRQTLSGTVSATSGWQVDGDDGIAYIQLAPTMVSGALHGRFSFTDGDTSREQDFEAWVKPGDLPWTLIGLGELNVGANSIEKEMDRNGNFDSDLGDHGRVAVYAKGQVLGSVLLTMAYDSAKQKTDQRLLGTIDPAAYYTVYGDGSERLYDAASREKLYLRVETSTFYALYGDFETGFEQTDLARYNRTATGVKSEGQFGNVRTSAFVAKVGTRHRRDEIQGEGITGPYRLSNRNIVANSEHVVIEVRDRLRSDIILETHELTRFVDYNIDLLSGTITFVRPLMSRDSGFNPQFAIVDFEVDELGKGEWNAGARATWTDKSGNLRVGATAITDKGDGPRTNLGAVDMRLRVGNNTEIRAEAGASRSDGETAKAGQVEVEHTSGSLDVLAYARQTDKDYGVGQQNIADRGLRKMGVDTRVQVSEEIVLTGSAWREESLENESRRTAGEFRATWRGKTTDAYIALAHLADHLADGRDTKSTMLEVGGTQRLLDNKLELTGGISLPLGQDEAVDLPARYQVGARYSLSTAVRVFGNYEIAKGDLIDARTIKVGAELVPWQGSTISTSLGKQALGADASRTFASWALGQTVQITEKLSVDASIDGNRTLGGGVSVADIFNPEYPVSSGGQLGNSGSLTEDFTSYSLGLNYVTGPWNARVRAEYQDGEFARRKGLKLAAIRQLGDGRVLGGGLTWTRAVADSGQKSEMYDAALTFAWRPASDELAVLGKLEYRGDAVTGAVAGLAGPAGQTSLQVDGDARLRRLLASTSWNWTPRNDRGWGRTEVALFTGLRYNFDQVDGYDLSTTSLLGGADLRFGIGELFEVGGRITTRYGMSNGTLSYSFGPEIGYSPVDNLLLSIGYNLTGFRDPDYSAARQTDKGLYATLRFKFDEGTLGLQEK